MQRLTFGNITDFFLRLGLQPGFVRGINGLVLGGLSVGVAYVSMARGGIYLVTLLLLLVMGLLLGGMRGLILGLLLNIPAYVLLQWPVPPQTAEFGTLLVALIVYLALVPGAFITLGFLTQRWLGVGIAAVMAIPLYVTFLVAFPLPLGSGAVPGAALALGGFGATFGFLWGIGAISPGAFAHEGPTYMARQRPLPNLYREGIATARRVVPQVIATFRPLVRPLLIAMGVALAIGVVFLLLGAVAPGTRPQTRSTAASALALTPDKLLLFLVIAAVIVGTVAALAFGLAFLMRYANREVVTAKEEPAQPLKNPPPAFRLANFFLSWIADILNGFRSSLQR